MQSHCNWFSNVIVTIHYGAWSRKYRAEFVIEYSCQMLSQLYMLQLIFTYRNMSGSA